MLDLKTGDAVWAGLDGIGRAAHLEASAAADGSADRGAGGRRPSRQPPKGATCAGRTLLPSPDGRRLVASVRAADNTDRWLVRVDPATGRSTRARPRRTTTRGCGTSGRTASYGGGLGWLPDSRRVWFLAEHDGWMQLYTVDVAAEHRRAGS